jgi:acyl-CoA dehydrogenase
MDFSLSEDQRAVATAVREVCAQFPPEYWRGLEPDRYPAEFVAEMTKHGWLASLIPEEYGGGGATIALACTILEEINASGGNAAACHAQMYTMASILRAGSDDQKQDYLPRIADGSLRLQAFGITEPSAGSDTPSIQTRAERTADGYLIHGQKVFTSRAKHSDLMLLLARTTPMDQVRRRGDGLSLFIVDLRAAGPGLQIRPLATMMNHATTEVFFDAVPVPAGALLGEEGKGFRYVLESMNAERILLASECLGDGRWFIERASSYANSRVVFGAPIGVNQGIQYPLARAYAALEAASLMRWKAASIFDAGQSCGAEANTAKFLASEASWQAANACLDTHGGWGFTREFDIERKFRETRLYMVAPISNNLVLTYLAEHVLGLPRR